VSGVEQSRQESSADVPGGSEHQDERRGLPIVGSAVQRFGAARRRHVRLAHHALRDDGTGSTPTEASASHAAAASTSEVPNSRSGGADRGSPSSRREDANGA